MFKWFRKNKKPVSTIVCTSYILCKIVQSCEDPNTVYHEFPDGLRLIIRDGKYDGHYVA